METKTQTTKEKLPRVWTKEAIQELLEKSDYAVERAILAIYARQLDGEKQGSAVVRNGVGFGAYDADYFCMRAQDILAGRPMSTWLADAARRRGIGRYWRQLMEIANENELKKAKGAVCNQRN